MIFTVEEILWSLSNMPENLIVHHILLTSGPEISQIRNLRIEQIDNFPVMTFPVLSWNVLGVAMFIETAQNCMRAASTTAEPFAADTA